MHVKKKTVVPNVKMGKTISVVIGEEIKRVTGEGIVFLHTA